ncbi:hypothetical protein SK128_023563, partial [Halocaridina rubra]
MPICIKLPECSYSMPLNTVYPTAHTYAHGLRSIRAARRPTKEETIGHHRAAYKRGSFNKTGKGSQ